MLILDDTNACWEWQVVVAVMLDSFYTARQKFREEAACEAALVARYGSYAVATAGDSSAVIAKAAAADRPLDPLLEELASSCDSDQALRLRINLLFERLNPHPVAGFQNGQRHCCCQCIELVLATYAIFLAANTCSVVLFVSPSHQYSMLNILELSNAVIHML